MNILILGANGYLGSKIAHVLAEQGNFLVCTHRKSSDLSRLGGLINSDKVRLVLASIDEIEAALQDMTIDWVLNIVCNYGKCGRIYSDVIEANEEFPLKVMNKLIEKGTKKFLTIGTGLPDNLNIYSFSKKIFSLYGEFYAKKRCIDFFDMKLEMFYGSDEPKSRFIPYLVYNMLLGNEINVTSGKQRRDIISINDVIVAVVMAMNSDRTGYNEVPVGTGISISVSELVDYIWEQTGKKSKINKGAIPLREDEPDCVADTSVINELGDWHPVFWKNGIKQMIEEVVLSRVQ